MTNDRPWDHLWVGAHVATMRANGAPYGTIERAALATDGARIAWIGPAADLPGPPADLARSVHDADGLWILPGLIDCHTHIVYGGNRADEFEQRLNGMSYEEIARRGGGIRATVAATRAASADVLYESAAKRLGALMAEGLTSIEIKSGYGLNVADEIKQLAVARKLGRASGLNVRTSFLGAHALPPEFAGRADAYIDFVCAEALPTVARAGLADAVDAFCETIGFTPDQVRRLFDAARALNLPVKLHAEQLSDQGGAALAARYGALSCDHLEYLSEDGVRAMAAAGSVAVLLPAAFYALGETRLPPIAALRSHGVPIAIASDCNPGSAPVTSVLLILNMACTLFRLTPEEALAGLTRNAARALGMAATHGTIEPDKAADLAFYRIERPAELAYRFGANPCEGAVRGGRPVGVAAA